METPTGQTLGRLWSQYLGAREELDSLDGEVSGYQELWQRANDLRDRLVVNYSPLVKYVSGKVYSRTSSSLEQEDLMSWGFFGLIDAIETYDLTRQATFETYAISKIRWAILDGFRKEDWMPRRLREKSREIEDATNILAQSLRRAPTDTEVAEELGMSLAEYQEIQDQLSRAQLGSLEARLEYDGNIGLEFQYAIADHSAADPHSQAEVTELQEHMVGAMGELDDRERLITTFYFYEGLTLREIGHAFGLSEGRISQILRGALEKLRYHLSESPLVASGR